MCGRMLPPGWRACRTRTLELQTPAQSGIPASCKASSYPLWVFHCSFGSKEFSPRNGYCNAACVSFTAHPTKVEPEAPQLLSVLCPSLEK